MLSIGNPDIFVADAVRAATDEKHPMTVARKSRRILSASRVDVGPQILRWTPEGIDARALGNPDVVTALATRTVGGEVQAEAILRDGWMSVAVRRIYRRTQ